MYLGVLCSSILYNVLVWKLSLDDPWPCYIRPDIKLYLKYVLICALRLIRVGGENEQRLSKAVCIRPDDILNLFLYTLQLISVGSNYNYGSEDQAEFLCVVSRDVSDSQEQGTSGNKPSDKAEVLK